MKAKFLEDYENQNVKYRIKVSKNQIRKGHLLKKTKKYKNKNVLITLRNAMNANFGTVK